MLFINLLKHIVRPKRLTILMFLVFKQINVNKRNRMRTAFVSYSIIALFCLTGCLSDKSVQDTLAFDIKKTYAEKEILLTDIADVTYVHLSTDNDDYLYSGRNFRITKNTVVVGDNNTGNILFFTKEGNPKSHFNHKGQGPEEYINIHQLMYDEILDEVYVSYHDVVQVYSSTGIYKRKISMPQGMVISDIIDFDDQSFFFFDGFSYVMTHFKHAGVDNYTEVDYVYPFYRVSKTTGEVLDYIEFPGTDLRLGYFFDRQWSNANPRIVLQKCVEGAWLCNIETDTIYLYRVDQPLTPVIYQTPSVRSLNPMEYISRIVDKCQYQYLQVTVLSDGGFGFFQNKYYLRNKITGETVHPKFLLSDYTGKEFIMNPQRPNDNGRVAMDGFVYDDGYCFELGLYELKQAYQENRLSGKLKELVSTLNEDEDNNVFMFVNFK